MPKRNIQEEPELVHPEPEQTRTILQRIASFFPLPRIRRSTIRQRPSTAPAAASYPPIIEISALLDGIDSPCPNDPDVYYSFPSIENSRRSSFFSGISSFLGPGRPTPTATTPSRPCSSGRSGSPCAHIAPPNPSKRPVSPTPNSGIRNASERPSVRSSFQNYDLDALIASHRASMAQVRTANPHFAGRPSTPSRPPTRRGRPADGTPLPFDKLQAYMALLQNQGTPPPSPPGSPRPVRNQIPGAPPLDRIPPRLSHNWLLPNSKNHPFVHRREFKRYCEREIAAGRGQELAAAMAAQKPRARTTSSAPVRPSSTDWSRTIQYKAGDPPVRPVPANRELDLELEASGVYKRRTARARAEARRRRRHNKRCKDDESESEGPPSEHSSDRDPYGFDPPLETPSTVGGTRMEIRGGDAATSGNHDSSYGLYNVTGAGCEWCACEEYVERGSSGESGSSSSAAVSSVRREAMRTPQIEPSLTIFNPCRDATRGSPHLRGGAGSSGGEARYYPRKLEDGDSIPSPLWYLAGGRDLPPTVREWRKKRPERRMGGLLGMAVFGERAGMPYGLRERTPTTRPATEASGPGSATAATPLGQGEREVHSALWGDGENRE